MSFNIGLSGIRAASSDLNITGNNIANASTVGFKSSRAEFADVYSASILGTGSNAQGSGAVLNNVAQMFTQGNINYTQNSLDLAINGNGFFVTSNNGALSYTRAGYFGTNQEGYIVNNNGERLQGFGLGQDGKIVTGNRVDLKVDTRAANPNATTKVTSTLNLSSSSVRPAGAQNAYDAFYSGNDARFADLTQQYLDDPANGASVPPSDADIAAARSAAINASYDVQYQAAFSAAQQAYLDDPNNQVQDPANPTDEERALAAAAAQVAGERAREAALVTDAQAKALETSRTMFNPTDASTYTSSTSVNVFDSQGKAHVMTKYFVKTDANTWDMHVLIDGRNQAGMLPTDQGFKSDTAAVLKFDKYGVLDREHATATIAGWEPLNEDGRPSGALPLNFTVNLAGSSQYASSFGVTAVEQDGFTTGELAGLEIDEKGVLIARYTNGQTKTQGQLALATFANQQGLKPLGDTAWAQSSASGEAVIGKPGSGTQGLIQSGALEQSNVDLSEMLINLIVAQRNYQANAKTIQTEDAVTQTIINLR